MAQSQNDLIVQQLNEDMNKIRIDQKTLDFNERCHRHTKMRYKLFNTMHIARKYGFDKNIDVENYEKKLINDIKNAGDNNTKMRKVEQQLGHYLEYLIDLIYNVDNIKT